MPGRVVFRSKDQTKLSHAAEWVARLTQTQHMGHCNQPLPPIRREQTSVLAVYIHTLHKIDSIRVSSFKTRHQKSASLFTATDQNPVEKESQQAKQPGLTPAATNEIYYTFTQCIKLQHEPPPSHYPCTNHRHTSEPVRTQIPSPMQDPTTSKHLKEILPSQHAPKDSLPSRRNENSYSLRS